MTVVAFRLPEGAPETVIDVYDSTLRLVTTLLSPTERAELNPGRYHALANPPEAPSLHAAFELDDVPLTVGFEPAPRHLSGDGRDLVLVLDTDEQLPLPWNWRPWVDESLGVFLYWREATWALPSSRRTAPDRWVDLRLHPGPQTDQQFDQCCILPRRAWPHLRPGVRIADGGVSLATRLRHGTARGLLSYMSQGRFTHADVLSRSQSLDAEHLLFDDADHDPVAASASALTLIMIGEFDRLGSWTRYLRDRFPWLPDGLVVDAERHARLGHHEDAAEILVGLLRRGLPCLTSALTIATSRARTYVDAGFGSPELRHLLNDLTSYAIASDLTAEVTTFTARSPWEPVPRAAATSH